MQKQPILILCICFVAGIALQDYLAYARATVLAVLSVAVLLFFIYFIKGFRAYQLRAPVLMLFFLSLGMVTHSLHTKRPETSVPAGKLETVFKLKKKLNGNEKNRRYEITAWYGGQQFDMVLSVPRAEPELEFLHYYKAQLYINPLEKAYSDFQFDYQKYLSRKNIFYQGYMPGVAQRQPRDDLSLSERIRQTRLKLLSKIDAAPLQKRTREFAKGIILADRTEMDRETLRDFRNSGTMHILAISGTHMAIIFGLLMAILNRLISEKHRRYKIVIALSLIWAFAIFIDYGNSVVRSCVMITCYYIFVLLQRKTDLLHSLAVAAFVILFTDSNQIFDVGFQLSFAAVLGIFWFNGPLLSRMPRPRNKFQKLLLNICTISIAAQLATLPLVIYYFHQYSSLSLLANLAIIPFAEIVIVFCLIMVVLIALSFDFSWLNALFDATISYSLQAVHYFGSRNFALYEMIPFTLLELALMAIMLFLLRPLILHFNIRHAVRLSYFLLLFISLRILLNYRAQKLEEVLVHTFFRQEIHSVKKDSLVTFYVSAEADLDKLKQYVIDPYLTSRRTKFYIIKPIDQSRSVLSR